MPYRPRNLSWVHQQEDDADVPGILVASPQQVSREGDRDQEVGKGT